MLDGVDVSYAQGNYRPGGEQFVICNASRANIGLAVGSMYRQQIGNARAAGKHVGHYLFNGNIDPTICADFFVNNLDYRPGDSLWLDVESEPSTGTVAWSPAQALAFLVRVKARLGVMPGVYLNRSLMDGQNWATVVAFGAPLWIAYYNPSPPPIRWWPDWTVWQYTSTPMDLNKAQGALTAASVAATPIRNGDDDTLKIYLLRNGDGSGSIAVVNQDGTIDPLTLPEYNAILDMAIQEPAADGSPYHQLGNGTDWNILAQRTARIRAAKSGDPSAIAQSVAALVVPAVIAGVQANGGTALTQEQVQAAAEAAIKDVFAAAAS